MILLPLLISFSIGHSLLRILLDDFRKLPLSLWALLSLGLGLGMSSSVTFFSFLLTGRFHAMLIIFLNLLVLGCLMALLFKSKKISWKDYRPGFKFELWTIMAIISWVILSILCFLIAVKQHPYGEWDAWAMWNLKMKFLILSDTPFQDILQKLHAYTHPDYPLLLPFLYVWIYAFTLDQPHPVPFYFSILLTVFCSVLLFGGLKKLANIKVAALASVLILANPYYIFLATSQYADVLMSFFLLSTMITSFLSVKEKDHALAFCSGSFLGLMTFTKNEGLVIAVLWSALMSFYLLREPEIDKRSRRELLKKFFKGLIIFSVPVLIFKIFLSPSNSDIIPHLRHFEFLISYPDKMAIILKAMFREAVHERWCFIWMFITLLFFLGPKKYFHKEIKIASVFFILYMGSIIFIYLTGSMAELAWWIKYSLSRIYFTLLPSLLFVSFYAHSFHDTKIE